MGGHGWAKFFHWACRILAYTCAAGVAFVGAALKADVKVWSTRWQLAGDALEGIQGIAWILVVVLPLGAAALCWVAKQIKEKWLTGDVQQILEQVRQFAFRSTAGQALDLHRVTLFRARWGLRGRRLVIVERTGHLTRRHRTSFRIPDSLDECEGIAGRTWGLQQALHVDDLPEVKPDATLAEVETYARATFVTPEWIRRKWPRARSYLGIPIEVNALRWGVLLIDSASTKNINVKPSAIRQYYPLAVVALAKLLERR